MKITKKDRPKVAAFEQSCPGLQPRNRIYDYYIKFPAKCKPILGPPRGMPRGEGVPSPCPGHLH